MPDNEEYSEKVSYDMTLVGYIVVCHSPFTLKSD